MRKTLPVLLLVALTLAYLFLVPDSYASDNQTSNSEIERIEYGDNSKTIYFKNGTKHVEVGLEQKITLTWEVTTTTTTATVISPISIFEIIGVLQIIYLAIAIITGVLGIFGITLYIRGKKKPDYIRHSRRQLNKSS